MRVSATILLFGVILSGCKPKSSAPDGASAAQQSILDREWALTSVGENNSPLGNGGKPVTLTFQSSDNRAFGNGGCNRYSATFTLSGDKLSFGPVLSTKMACEQGTDVEVSFLSMLGNVTTFQATDSSLTLVGVSGPLARFREA